MLDSIAGKGSGAHETGSGGSQTLLSGTPRLGGNPVLSSYLSMPQYGIFSPAVVNPTMLKRRRLNEVAYGRGPSNFVQRGKRKAMGNEAPFIATGSRRQGLGRCARTTLGRIEA